MGVGAKVRAAFGPYEPQVANLWRTLFFDLSEWTRIVAHWAPAPARILEVGCGEGYSTAQLARAFPGVPIDAIDIADNIGRLYDGPQDAVKFQIAFAEDLAKQSPGSYDLIVLADVLHHVPAAQRVSLLDAIKTLLAPGGTFAFKDWHRDATRPIHWAVYGADRYLTGDRIAFLRRNEARTLLESVFGPNSIQGEETIRPWTNDYAFQIVAS